MIIIFGLESFLLEQESNIEIYPKIKISFFIKIQIYQDYFFMVYFSHMQSHPYHQFDPLTKM